MTEDQKAWRLLFERVKDREPMLDRMANQATTNQIIIQIDGLTRAVEALEVSDYRWNQVARYLASALVTAEAIK